MSEFQEQLKEKLESLKEELFEKGYFFGNVGDGFFTIENKIKNRRIDVNYKKGYITRYIVFRSGDIKPDPEMFTFEELKLCCLMMDYFNNFEEFTKLKFDKITELEFEINILKGENAILKEQNKKRKEEIKKEILKNVKKTLEVEDV